MRGAKECTSSSLPEQAKTSSYLFAATYNAFTAVARLPFHGVLAEFVG
jgi:hypothetical protein